MRQCLPTGYSSPNCRLHKDLEGGLSITPQPLGTSETRRGVRRAARVLAQEAQEPELCRPGPSGRRRCRSALPKAKAPTDEYGTQQAPHFWRKLFWGDPLYASLMGSRPHPRPPPSILLPTVLVSK